MPARLQCAEGMLRRDFPHLRRVAEHLLHLLLDDRVLSRSCLHLRLRIPLPLLISSAWFRERISLLTSRLPDAPRPPHKMLEELADEILRRFISQVSFFIKAGSSVANHHFGLVDGEHIEVHENL